MENKEVKENKSTFNCRLTKDDTELLNEFKALYEELNNDDLSTDRKLLVAALESAISRKKPIEVSKPADLERIKQLEGRVGEFEEIYRLGESEKKELEIRNRELMALIEGKTEVISQYESEMSQLKAENEKLKVLINDSKENYLAIETQKADIERQINSGVLFKFNDFQKDLINAYLSFPKQIEWFNRMNDGGKYNGFVNRLDSADHKQNMINLLLNVFVCSAYGYEKVYRLFSKEQIQKAYMVWKNKQTKQIEQ